jgi:hypothetical protein
MKEKYLNFLNLLRNIFLDIIIIIGILIFSYNILRPVKEESSLPSLPSFSYIDYHTEEKVFGIFLIVVGVDLIIRKYLFFKNERKI